MALERPIRVERGPAAAAHIVAFVGALPRELNAGPAATIRVAAVKFSRHYDEAQIAEAVIIELDEAGLDQIDGILIPVVHLGDAPSAHNAHGLGHATRIAAPRRYPETRGMPYQSGDVLLANHDPVAGHEQGGRRPVLVLSGASYNELRNEQLIVAAITSRQ